MDIEKNLIKVAFFTIIGSMWGLTIIFNRKSDSFADSASLYLYLFTFVALIAIVFGALSENLWGSVNIIYAFLTLISVWFLKLFYLRKNKLANSDNKSASAK